MAQRATGWSSATTGSSIDHLRIDGVSRVHPDRRVLTDVSFSVARDARVALIGENGSGKSTLLRIVAGRDRPDAGRVETPARIGLLQQEPPFAVGDTVAAVLDAAVAEATDAVREVEDASTALAAGEARAGGRLDAALDAADRLEAWTVDVRRGEVLAGLGLRAIGVSRAVGSLSGGQRSRLAMAALLLERPSALLLDEPTNHLDDDAVDFLRRTLLAWPGPVLLASHDRSFIDEVATRIVDLDPAPMAHEQVRTHEDAGSGYGVSAFRGGYRDYLAERRRRREAWLRRYLAEQDELGDLRHEVAVTARETNKKDHYQGARAGLTKFLSDKDAKVTSRRVRNAAVRLATLEREQVRRPPAELAFAGLPAAPVAGSPGPLLVAAGVAVAGRLAPIRLAVGQSEKLLVTGPNGAGKSTLLLVLAGVLDPTSGSVQRAPGVTTALLEQDVVFPDPARSPRAIYEAALGERRAEAVPLRGLGLIAGRDLDRPTRSLSVGQQRRLALALIVADPPHVLLLDEPTNHLSLALAEDLEDALDTHAGGVVMASHDRWTRARWSHGVVRLEPPS